MFREEFRTGVIKPVDCYKEGWELIKGQYWILFAVSIIGLTISGISLYILLGAMICGIFYCFFQVIDGGRAEFEGLFKGFRFFLPSLPVMLLIFVPMILVFSLVYVPLFYSMMRPEMTDDEFFTLLTGTFVIEFFVALIMVSLHTLLMFAFPLIVDRNLGGWQAVKTSARAVRENLGGVAGLWVVGFVIGIIGYLLLCIGIYFVIPIIFAGNAVAYRKVFPKDDSINSNPSPLSNIYQNTGSQI